MTLIKSYKYNHGKYGATDGWLGQTAKPWIQATLAANPQFPRIQQMDSCVHEFHDLGTTPPVPMIVAPLDSCIIPPGTKYAAAYVCEHCGVAVWGEPNTTCSKPPVWPTPRPSPGNSTAKTTTSATTTNPAEWVENAIVNKP
jgi:hypothetical protein